jgi:cytochrome c oxidase subunit 3
VTAASPEVRVQRTPVLVVGTVVWLASELMFFAGLFAAYFALRSNAGDADWPPADVELEVAPAAAFTALLVLSSVTVQLAVRAVRAGDRAGMQRWLWATVVLAVAFLANQGREWAVADFEVDSHSYGSAFYLMTGFHGLHVIGGLLAMAVLLARSLDPRFGRAQEGAVEVVGAYWHLVDVVWVVMFTTLFLIR